MQLDAEEIACKLAIYPAKKPARDNEPSPLELETAQRPCCCADLTQHFISRLVTLRRVQKVQPGHLVATSQQGRPWCKLAC